GSPRRPRRRSAVRTAARRARDVSRRGLQRARHLRRRPRPRRPLRRRGVSERVDFDSVQVVDVSRHFGRRRALANISLTAGAGDIVGLLGPNGAGKSTLITMLATLAAPSKGEIRYGDATASRLGPPLRTRIGLLAHELHLYPELSARQNLRFFAALYGVDPDALVEDALISAGLAERGDDAVSSFSRGMRQRLALERALLHGP